MCWMQATPFADILNSYTVLAKQGTAKKTSNKADGYRNYLNG
jgi:hypothetical protein